jgi:hypothetical protein
MIPVSTARIDDAFWGTKHGRGMGELEAEPASQKSIFERKRGYRPAVGGNADIVIASDYVDGVS